MKISFTLLTIFLFTLISVITAQTLEEDYYFPVSADELEVVSSEDQPFMVETLIEGLNRPWGIAFLPNGKILITEKPGNIRLIRDGSLQVEPISGVPDVNDSGQGGLLDIVPHPDYETNGWIYFTYSKPGQGGANTALMRAKLDGNSLTEQEELFAAEPFTNRRQHYGSRIVFDNDGYLYFSIGDRGQMDSAQDLTQHAGSILRVHDDGEVPSDNPFVNRPGAQPEIYSYGHRNPQGLTLHPETGDIWSHEHGPRGGDEINIIREGLNYGWPEITHGVNYNGSIITEHTEMPGMESPLHDWTPSIAPSGMTFVWSDRYPGWKGNLFSGALAFQLINRNVIEDDQIVHEERLLQGIGRIRDIRMGPDGFLYILEESRGRLLRLLPAE